MTIKTFSFLTPRKTTTEMDIMSLKHPTHNTRKVFRYVPWIKYTIHNNIHNIRWACSYTHKIIKYALYYVGRCIHLFPDVHGKRGSQWDYLFHFEDVCICLQFMFPKMPHFLHRFFFLLFSRATLIMCDRQRSQAYNMKVIILSFS